MKFVSRPLWRLLSSPFLGTLVALGLSIPATAQDYQSRPELQQLKEEMMRDHQYDGSQFDRVFATVKRLDRVIALMDTPIRAPLPWPVYLERHVGGDRVVRGSRFMQENRGVFMQAEKAYGVPPSVIASIIGVETLYGRVTGNFRIVDAVATLAFDYPRRADFFRNELKEVLLLARELKRSPLELRGSFAGAMGWPQFMPSSYRSWAVDFNNDGVIDLWNTPADIIGSVASFLSNHGWQRGEPVMYPILPPSAEIIATIDGGLSPRKPLGEWLAAGIVLNPLSPLNAKAELPANDASVGIISLDNAAGGNDYWMVFENFYVITRYNRSRMYASSVWSLARSLQAAAY